MQNKAEAQPADASNACDGHILILTESKIDDTIPINLITKPGYHEPLRRDRNRNGGGVLIYIAENFIFNQQTNLQSQNYEHIWVDIKLGNAKFAINALYRPPDETSISHNDFLNTMNNILQELSNYNATDAAASDLFSSFGFTQLIDIPTRITENTISLIDLIFEMNTERVSSHGTLPKIADHDGIIVSYDLESEKNKI